MARLSYQYPSTSPYIEEQPLWVTFSASTYSLVNRDRTRDVLWNRRFAELTLPMPKVPGYSLKHEFGEGTNPVGPVLSMGAVANSGGFKNFDTLWNRILAPDVAANEYMYSTSTYRRFSNISEYTMVSEARRIYAFDYIFAPKNDADSIQVENIIGTFRKSSYPNVANGLPERTYPQNLWTIGVSPGFSNNPNPTGPRTDLTANWLGEPLPCVLQSMVVKKNDDSDPVIRLLPNGLSNVTLLGLVFVEFETGSYDYDRNQLLSKSEVSYNSFGTSST
jgi:hypothetical protein